MSIADFSDIWDRLAELLVDEQLPEPYDKWESEISCLDCQHQAIVSFHYQYHRCPSCKSYNTQKLRVIRPEFENNSGM